ncbi:MAG TPA: hypothetical protein VNN17_08230, partial [Terriglobia bacterium]|nr:hypothetical protein [Terriglobia bacterium]
IRFTDEEALEQDQRAEVPRPPLPEINRLHASVSLEYSGIVDRGDAGGRSSQEGVSVRANMTRLGGTYWNVSGYWRGRRTSHRAASQTETLSDLLSRTYHISLSYHNPQSRNVAGFGRLLLPFASSLSTLDGGYFGRRIGNATTLGVFAGTTPDPTAWNFDPDRQMFGVFGNREAGSFESWRYSSTVGVAQTRLEGRPERYFLFSEQNLLLTRVLSIYHNAEVDYHRRGEFAAAESGIALTRSFLTFRAQPAAYLSFDLSHNYFQTVPTSDPRLIGTGLIDKVLFQGLSGGVRLRPIPLLTLYASLGRSDRQGDATPSWNYQYGATVDRIPGLGLRTDVRLSRFTSSFGSGAYQSASISRVVGEVFHLEVQVGRQNFHSALTIQNRTQWLNTNLDWFLGRHYVLGAGGTLYRGQAQNYDQWFFSLGYRL